jgi:radical SAM protein with 4Fe4S-binding SPASM domain
MAWKASHYTHLIPLADGNGVVYNGRSGALVKLSAGAFARCGTIMKSSAQGKPLSASFEKDDLFAHLVAGSFVGLYQFPEPKLYNCGAIGTNGFIFNPNGEIHKCGLAVDDSSEAIGQLGEELDSSHPNAVKWCNWSPLDNPVCRGCEFLPSCLGGCPRNQMQMREVQKKENCQYYQQHENRILATHLELAQL